VRGRGGALYRVPTAAVSSQRIVAAFRAAVLQGESPRLPLPSAPAIASQHRFLDHPRLHPRGDPIPRIDYTPDEVRAWGTALRELKLLFPTAACREFLHTFPMFSFRRAASPHINPAHACAPRATPAAACAGWARLARRANRSCARAARPGNADRTLKARPRQPSLRKAQPRPARLLALRAHFDQGIATRLLVLCRITIFLMLQGGRDPSAAGHLGHSHGHLRLEGARTPRPQPAVPSGTAPRRAACFAPLALSFGGPACCQPYGRVSSRRAPAVWPQVRPVAGLMHPRDFLNGLAFKYFHSTQVCCIVRGPDRSRRSLLEYAGPWQLWELPACLAVPPLRSPRPCMQTPRLVVCVLLNASALLL
jgi:hypothetical protein